MVTEGHDAYPWARQPAETHQSYGAFRVYMDARSTTKVAEQLSKSDTIIKRWCTEHRWVERVSAYDVYIAEAQTDGAVDWITNARSETQSLADKLRGLLSERLDDCIRTKQDPTMRWSSAAQVLLKLQEAGIAPVSDDKMAAELDRVSKMIERIEGAVV